MTPAEIRDRLIAQRVVPVLRLAAGEEAERAVDCLEEAGYIVHQRALAAGDRARVIAHARRFLEPGAGVSAA